MKQFERSLTDTFKDIGRKLGAIPKTRRRFVWGKIDSLIIKDLNNLGIKLGGKKCPYCNNRIKEFKYPRHIFEGCSQVVLKLALIPIARRKILFQKINSLFDSESAALSDIRLKLKTFTYNETSVQLWGFKEDINNNKLRISKDIKQKSNHNVPSSYVGNKRKCRFCEHPPIPGGDLCYSCNND